jgi:hypothetical protein
MADTADEVTFPRDGMPWTPEEDLMVLLEETLLGYPLAALEKVNEKFKAIQWMRDAAIGVVTVHASGGAINDAIAELEQALLAEVEFDEP